MYDSEYSMVNEYANSAAVMYAINLAEEASAKRRKMLAMNPYDDEEVNDSKYKMIVFRMRKSEDRPMYEYSTWGRMLLNPRTRDPGDRKGGVLFRLRFRVPFPLFERIVALTRENNWFTERGDASGRRGAPLELKILGVLRVLGRGYCFDGIEELSFISAECNRIFFHSFCSLFSKKYFEIYCNAPLTDDEVNRTLSVYDRLDFPGCIGSTDCVHIRWERCPVGDRSLHKGKEGYPTISYEVTVDHTSKIISATKGFPGAKNDKTIVRFDGFVSAIHDEDLYSNVRYKMCKENGEEYLEKGCYLLVDGGYHKWRCLQCPLRHSAIKKEALWSEWAESVRKDVECTFGSLKGRFRCLKVPIFYNTRDVVDNMFFTCCIFHNLLLTFDGLDVRWEKDVNYAGRDGEHAAEDMFIFRQHLSRVRNLTSISDYSYIGVERNKDIFEFSHGDEVEEYETSYSQLNKKLVDHFAYKHSINDVKWLKKKCV